MSKPADRAPPPADASPTHVRLAALVLVVATVVAYGNSVAVPFLFDDVPTLVENPAVRQLWPSATEQSGGFTTSGRPLLHLTFALNHRVHGYAVEGYHVVNIAIHAAAGLLLLGVVRRTLLLPTVRKGRETHPLPLALAVAAGWTLHPLQTESVTYLMQRAESLAGMFYLLTLYGFVRGAEPGAARGWPVITVVACALGVAAKEIVVSAPLIVLLYDRTFLSGTFRAAWQARRNTHLALASTWLLLGFLVLGTANRGGTAGLGTEMSSWTYALTQCRALVHYAWLSMWPDPLVFDHGLATVRDLVSVMPQALLIVGAGAGVVVALVRRSPWGFAGGLFFAVLAPSSSFVPVVTQTMAEHRMYLPLAVVVTAGVVGACHVAGLRALPPVAAAIIALGLLTSLRNRDYRSEAALWAHTAAHHPTNARAHNNLGQALFRRGNIEGAIACYERALRLQPNYPETHYNLAVALARRDQLPVALEHYATALHLQPTYPEAHNNLGNALVRLGRTDEAIQHYEIALKQDPRFAEAENNLGNALLASNLPLEGMVHFERALRLRPGYPEARYNWGNALAAEGKMSDALNHYREALRLKPDYAEAHVNAGNAQLSLEQLPAAVSHYEKALALDPNLAEAANNLGTVYLHTGRVSEAIAQFERALAIRPEFAAARENLQGARARLRQPP